MGSGIKITGVEELQAAFREVLRQAPDRVEEQLVKMGRRLRKKTRERTPERTGRLRKGYRLSEPKRLPDGYKLELHNKEPYFHVVERGHRKVDPDGREWGFVPGQHMLEQSVTEMDEAAPEELQKWLNKLYKELHSP